MDQDRQTDNRRIRSDAKAEAMLRQVHLHKQIFDLSQFHGYRRAYKSEDDTPYGPAADCVLNGEARYRGFYASDTVTYPHLRISHKFGIPFRQQWPSVEHRYRCVRCNKDPGLEQRYLHLCDTDAIPQHSDTCICNISKDASEADTEKIYSDCSKTGKLNYSLDAQQPNKIFTTNKRPNCEEQLTPTPTATIESTCCRRNMAQSERQSRDTDDQLTSQLSFVIASSQRLRQMGLYDRPPVNTKRTNDLTAHVPQGETVSNTSDVPQLYVTAYLKAHAEKNLQKQCVHSTFLNI